MVVLTQSKISSYLHRCQFLKCNYITNGHGDYFTKYLLGAEPPKEYQMHPPRDPAKP